MSASPSSSTWVLLRGLARESAHWGGFPERLGTALGSSARVIALDTPGNGRHRKAPVRSLARSLEVVREDLEVVAPATSRGATFVFGISMGGMIALEWAKRYGAELAGVAVGNSSAGDLSPPWQRMRPDKWPVIARSFVDRNVPRREALILDMVANDRSARDATLAAWVEIARARPPVPRASIQQLVAAIRFRAPAAPLGCPLLLLAGDGDRFVAPQCSRQLARRYGVPLEVHPTAGHELSQDAPEWLIEQLTGFAASERSSARAVAGA